MNSRLFTLGLPTFVLLASTLLAHQGDPKAQARSPYRGSGYRRAAAGGPQPFGPPGFASDGILLLSWLPLGDFGAGISSGNDCWGYVSPSGREYALFGHQQGTAVVEVTDPTNAQIVGQVNGRNSLWRDIKVYGDHAYAVSEGGGGVQVIDLSQVDRGVVTHVGDVTTGGVESSHNVALDVESGFLYRCGGSNNGLRIYSLADPANPVWVGEWADRYVHDAQVVTYSTGPFAPRQIAYCCSGFDNGYTEPGLDIVDVTDKQNPFLVKRLIYASGVYSHQAWLSGDRRYLYLNDELDEDGLGIPTDTKIIDVSDIENPVEVANFTNGNPAIGHNLYVRGDTLFEANYRSGLRVFDATDPVNPVEVAFFDTYPDNDSTGYNGLWSVYPFFPSGIVVGSDIDRGLFVWTVGEAALAFRYPNGLPDVVSPSGDTLVVELVEQAGTLESGSVRLHYDVGNGFQEVRAEALGGNLYEASFPALSCGVTVRYYLSAETTAGERVTDPPFAPPPTFRALVTLSEIVAVEDDGETDIGWTVGAPGDDATTGIWERVDPVGTAAQPEDDHSEGGTICWVTGQGAVGGGLGDNDVDGGQTTLLSPVFDAAGLVEPRLRYWRWYSNSEGGAPHADVFVVDISNDGGVRWVNVETVGPAGPETSGGWIFREILVSNHVTPTDQLTLRFIASDAGDGSVIEAAIDDLRLSGILCVECDGTGGDCNQNTNPDDCDIAEGTSLDANGNGIPDECECAHAFIRGDGDGNGDVGLADALYILGWLFTQGPAPFPQEAAEVNDDDIWDLSDAIYVLQYVFANGPEPAAPFPEPGCEP